MPRQLSSYHGWDAIVIGARCAGAATAMLLARTGARVLVVDRDGYGADTLSTHALMRPGVALLHRWGVLDGILAANTPRVTKTTFVYGDERVEVEIRPGDGITGLRAPRRTVLDRALADAAMGAGAELLYGVTLDALVQDGTGRVRGVRLRDAKGRLSNERARLVIGADGRQSTVAKLTEAPVLAGTTHSTAGIFGYFPGIENRGYRWFFRDGLHMAAIPTNDGLHCVCVLCSRAGYRQMFGADAAAGFRAQVASFDPELGEAVAGDPVPGFSRYTGAPGHLRQAYGPGWALVGDAGYFKDPITAHGITDALRDAELLARAVIRSGAGGFAHYQATRDRLSRELFEVTAEIAGFGWTLDTLKGLHARLSAAMKAEHAHMIGNATPQLVA